MTILIWLFAATYLAMFPVVAIYAQRIGDSVLWGIFDALMLTPFIALIKLYREELEKQQEIKRYYD